MLIKQAQQDLRNPEINQKAYEQDEGNQHPAFSMTEEFHFDVPYFAALVTAAVKAAWVALVPVNRSTIDEAMSAATSSMPAKALDLAAAICFSELATLPASSASSICLLY